MRVLEFLLGRDPEDAKKLFDEAHADLIDILNNPGVKFNGHGNGLAYAKVAHPSPAAGRNLYPVGSRVLGNKPKRET